MGDSKKKSSWISWVIIALAFVVLIVYLMITLIKNNNANGEATVHDKLLKYVSVWGETFDIELEHGREFGQIIADTIDNEGVKATDSKILGLVHSIVDNSVYYRGVVVSGNSAIDDLGQNYDMSAISEQMSNSETAILFLDSDGAGKEGVFAVTYPVSDSEYILLFASADDIADTFEKSGYENTSFGAFIRKDGSIMTIISAFGDSNSKFLTGDNLLSTIQEGTTREKYNYFKSKIYGEIGYAIGSNFEGDERTIVCVPLAGEDWYFCAGFRQYEVDQLIDYHLKSIRGTTVKLAISMIVFVVFSLGYLFFLATRTKERGKRLENRADTDLLTELTNKAATERMIAEYIENSPDARGLLFILDIDNFKKVNDTMGHAFGDVLLKTLGKQIRTEFRVTDIVGRTGGDEFMIFLKDIKDDLIVEREANRVTHFFHDFKAGDGYVKYSATASIGVAVFPDDGKSFKELYVSADQALYRAKKRGKNQLVFFNEEKYGIK